MPADGFHATGGRFVCRPARTSIGILWSYSFREAALLLWPELLETKGCHVQSFHDLPL